MDRPDAAELLEVARELLLERLLPALDESLRYDARMVANALAIAAREVRARAGDAAAARPAGPMLADLYGEPPDTCADALRRRLAADLRRGELDGACEPGVRAILRADVEARLAIGNPRHLAQSRQARGVRAHPDTRSPIVAGEPPGPDRAAAPPRAEEE